ncbi:MAG: tetratricopeptide repeat protein [Candidatus Methylomirabilales bacterium]
MSIDKRKVLEVALAYTQQGKLDRAIAEYQAILKADPSDFNVLNTLGDLYARTGNQAEAIAHFMRLGEAYRVDGLNIRAIAVYKKVIKLDPFYTEAYFACADLYAEQGLTGEAKLQLQGIAEPYLKRGDVTKAVEIYEKMIRLDPGHVPTVSKIVEILTRAGRAEEALVQLDALGERLLSAGQVEGVQQIYNRVLELLKSQGREAEAALCADRLKSLALAEAKAGTGEVMPAASPDEEDRPQPAEVVVEEVSTLEISPSPSEDREEAVATDLIDEALERLRPEPEEAVPAQDPRLLLEGTGVVDGAEDRLASEQMAEADIYVRYGLLEKAIQHLQEVLTYFPDHMPSRRKLQQLYRENGDTDAAVQEGLILLEIYQRQGADSEAAELLGTLLSLAPTHPKIQEAAQHLKPGPVLLPESIEQTKPAAIELEIPQGSGEPAVLEAPTRDTAEPVESAAMEEKIQKATPVFRVAETTAPRGEYVDLAGELSEELSHEETPPPLDQDPEMKALLHELERGIREQVDVTDYETHYNLGIAYKDMELYDKAVEEFRLAAREATYRVWCAGLLGLCYLAKGEPERAVEELLEGIAVTEMGIEERWGILYDLATAYEALGDPEKALEALVAIQREAPKFRDIRVRIRDIRGRLDAGWESPGKEEGGETQNRPPGHRISFL